MNTVLLIVVLAFAAGVIVHEMWEYVTRHAGDNPFVNARRLWRRSFGALALAVAMVVFYFFDAIVKRFPSAGIRIALLALMLGLIAISVWLAFRDARIATEIALREQQRLARRSGTDLQRAARRGAAAPSDRGGNESG